MPTDRVRKFLYSPNSKYVLAIILGIGLSSLFRKVCKDRNCLVFKSPDLKEVNGKIFKYNNKCYKYEQDIKTCDTNKKIVNYA